MRDGAVGGRNLKAAHDPILAGPPAAADRRGLDRARTQRGNDLLRFVLDLVQAQRLAGGGRLPSEGFRLRPVAGPGGAAAAG